MPTVHANDLTVDQYLSGNKLVVIDWSAVWCAPCKLYAPIFERVSAKYPDIVFLKIDIDESPNIARAFSIRGAPTTSIVFNKKVLSHQMGAMQERKLDELVANAKQQMMNGAQGVSA